MPEYLQTTIDKFTFRVAMDRLYTADGVWVFFGRSEGDQRIRIGVTDFVQQRNGDMAFANVKPPGTRLAIGSDFAELETMKVNVGLSSPVSGVIVEINPTLALTPEVINQDPYGRGWLAEVEATSWDDERAKLLDPSAYLSAMQSQAEEELKA